MNKNQLRDELKSQIESMYGYPADSQVMLTNFCQALADAIVDHIKNNATITLQDGDIPVQVSTGSGTGATKAATLNMKVS